MPVKKKKTQENPTFSSYVVGIGASAGGLEAINELIENTSTDTGFAFIVVQHLSPDHKSLMSELLAKHTLMRVNEATDGAEVQPNCIYLLPSKKFISIRNRTLWLHDKAKSSLPNNAIDVFFESLAEDCGEKAVGIILSGTGTDGTKGLEKIKQKGGVAVVQDPFTAAFDGMPNSAIAAGLADLIFAPESIMPELLDYLKESDTLQSYQLTSYHDEYVLRDILGLIRKETGHDYSYYKRPTLLRRLSKRLMELNIRKIREYLDYLSKRPDEIRYLAQDFLINVTYFFRDRSAFETIQHVVIPSIMKEKSEGDTVKVWSVACSSGEEAYSLAILFHEFIEKKKILDINIKIFATDIDKEALDRASKGVYTKTSLKDVSEARRERYFTADGDNYRVNQEIRRMIVFSHHDILRDPPFSRMDLISCRNMLIYVSAAAQKEIIKKIHFALNIDSYLFLGPSEHVGGTMTSMQEIDKKWRIYKNVARPRPGEGDPVFAVLDRGIAGIGSHKVKNPINHISDIFKETLLEEYRFAGIFVDTNFDVKQATGFYKSYIELPDGGFNFNITKLVHHDLAIALNVALRKALKENQTVTLKQVKVGQGHESRCITITVRPYVKQSGYQQQFLFIVLNEESKSAARNGKKGKQEKSSSDRVHELESELRETKENLQAVIEEIEAANEELQSTNEEMVSTNEELQSTNEELQSLNEELHTVSSEHQLKIRELMELNDDLNNYFNNSGIGQILVDKNLIIRKFSPAVTRMVNLIESDLNRPIIDITTRFSGDDFIGRIREVMKTNQPFETEVVQDSDYYLMRITPYVRQDKSVDGAVINFIDITETKKVSSILTAVLDSAPSSITAMRAVRNRREEIEDFEIMIVNSSMERQLQMKSGDLKGTRLKDLPGSVWTDHFKIYKDVVETGEEKHFEYYNEHQNRWFDLVLVKLMDGIVTIETDITDKKKAADLIAQSFEDLKATSRQLKTTNLKLEQSNMDLLQFASVASHDLKEPLRKIQTFGNILMAKAKDKLDTAELGHLNKIITSSGRMQKLIEDVLTLSKLSNRDLEFEEVDLNEVLGLIKDDLEIIVKEKNAEISVRPLPHVKGVSGQMHQIFQNLISNALKFSNGEPPKITISEKPVTKEIADEFKLSSSKYHMISVKDNGIGFEETYKDKIFGIFQRLNGNNYEGTGIGLAICKKIIENHNGYITVHSTPGEGTEFFLVLPKK